MPSLGDRIDGFVVGDHLGIRRRIHRSKSGFASGVTITEAWMTIQTSAGATPDLVSKNITGTNVAGTGHIENTGTGDVNPVLRFDLEPADTSAIGTTERVYDIQILTSGSSVYTIETGTIQGTAQLTTDT